MSLNFFKRRVRLESIKPSRNPLDKPDYTEADVQALRAVWRGHATADQQIRSIEWMVDAFGTYDVSFRPESPRLTDFAEGRRYAGQILVWMLMTAPVNTDPDKIAARLARSTTAGEQGHVTN